MKFNFNAFDIKNSIAFQKKLMAKCAIPKGNGQKEDCAIYLLDRSLPEDRFYYQKAKRDNPIWKNSQFINIIDEYISDPNADTEEDLDLSETEFYTMEDSSGNCIGHCATYVETPDTSYYDKPTLHVEYLERIPETKGNKAFDYKYIGQTLLSFLAMSAKKRNLDNLNLYMAKNSNGFYLRKCFFKKEFDSLQDAYLASKDYDKLIEANNKNRGNAIEFFG